MRQLPWVSGRYARGGQFAAGPAAPAGDTATAPNEVDDLVEWMDAGQNADSDTSETAALDGEVVDMWRDAHTHGSKWDIYWSASSQPTLESSPGGQNGKPYLNFTGKAMYNASTDGPGTPNVNAGTLFWVYQPDASTGSNHYMLRNHNDLGRYILNTYTYPGPVEFITTHWGMDDYVYFQGRPNANFAVITITCDGGTTEPKCRLNGGAPLAVTNHAGAAHSASPTDQAPIWGQKDGSSAGASYIGYGAGAKMNLYQFFTYSRVLSNSEMDGIHDWIAAEYDVTQDAVTD